MDFDPFLRPHFDELKVPAGQGVECRRYLPKSATLSDIFTLRAHVIMVTGDMPAIAKVSPCVPSISSRTFLNAKDWLHVVDEIQRSQREMPVSFLHYEGDQAEIWKDDHVLHDEKGGTSEE